MGERGSFFYFVIGGVLFGITDILHNTAVKEQRFLRDVGDGATHTILCDRCNILIIYGNLPAVDNKKRNNNLTSVVLPDPELPISANRSLLAIFRLNCLNILSA